MATGTVACPGCGREYVWQATLAGHPVRCTCGQTLDMPQSRPDFDSVYALAPSDSPGGRIVPDSGHVGSGDEAAMPCPACGQPIAFAGVLCTACGYNVRTGEVDKRAVQPVNNTATTSPAQQAMAYFLPTATARRSSEDSTPAARFELNPPEEAPPGVGAAPAAPQAPVGPLPPFRGHTKPRVHDEELRKDGLVRYVVGVAALVVLVLGLWFSRGFWGRPNDPGLTGDDAAIASKLSGVQASEARAWLEENDNRMAGGWNSNQARARIDEWYRLGARKVWSAGGTIALSLIIELPEEKEKRDKLFGWQREYHRASNQPIAEDKGQKYLTIVCPP